MSEKKQRGAATAAEPRGVETELHTTEEVRTDAAAGAPVVGPAGSPALAPEAPAVSLVASGAVTLGPHDELIDRWFAENFHGSPVARDTAVYNQVFAAKEDLKRRLAKQLGD